MKSGSIFTITYDGKTHTVPAIIAPNMVMCGTGYLPGVKEPDLSSLGLPREDSDLLEEVMAYCVNEGAGHEKPDNGNEVELSNGIAKWSYTPVPKGQKGPQ